MISKALVSVDGDAAASLTLARASCTGRRETLAPESVCPPFKEKHKISLPCTLESRGLTWSGTELAAFGDLIFNVVYQVCSGEIEVRAKFQEEMKESWKCNLLFCQSSQALG